MPGFILIFMKCPCESFSPLKAHLMKVNVTPPRVLAIYSAPTRIDRGLFLFLSLAVTFYLLCRSHPILSLSQPEIKLSENTK